MLLLYGGGLYIVDYFYVYCFLIQVLEGWYVAVYPECISKNVSAGCIVFEYLCLHTCLGIFFRVDVPWRSGSIVCTDEINRG
jgi:uncharacterized YccA/Bax inhibitor family protein